MPSPPQKVIKVKLSNQPPQSRQSAYENHLATGSYQIALTRIISVIEGNFQKGNSNLYYYASKQIEYAISTTESHQSEIIKPTTTKQTKCLRKSSRYRKLSNCSYKNHLCHRRQFSKRKF